MSLHSAEEAQRWLDTSAAPLSLQDRKAFQVRGTQRAWRVPVTWGKIDHVVVALPDRFPYVLPEVMLPYEYRAGILIPHVTPDDGFVCYSPESALLDPSQSLQMVLAALDLGRTVVEKEYSADELKREVQRELRPYWRFTPEFQLASIAPEKIASVFAVDKQGDHFLTRSLNRKHPDTFKQIGISLKCPGDEALDLIQRPEVWLARHPELSARAENLAAASLPGGIPVKKSTIYFSITVELPSGSLFLMARLNEVRLPRNSETKTETLFSALTTALSSQKVERGSVIDLSTRRLMNRTQGDYAETLLTKRIAIIGCGSLGGFIADNLARAGVRIFFLNDRENLEIQNVPRHCSDIREVGYAKMEAVKRRVRSILPDAEVAVCGRDFAATETLAELNEFKPDLIVFAVGNTTVEVAADGLRAAGKLPNVCFTWIEAKLAAAHLLFCPSGSSDGFSQLIDLSTGQYLHREIRDEENQVRQESGCQSTFAPYSGLDLVIAAGIISRQIVKWLLAPPSRRRVLKFKPEDFDLTDVLPGGN